MIKNRGKDEDSVPDRLKKTLPGLPFIKSETPSINDRVDVPRQQHGAFVVISHAFAYSHRYWGRGSDASECKVTKCESVQ